MQCENLRVLRIHPCAFPFVDHLTNLASLACRSNPQGAKQHLALLLPLPRSATLDTSSSSISSVPPVLSHRQPPSPPKLPSSPVVFAYLTIIRRHGGYVSSPFASAAEAIVKRIKRTALLISVRYCRRSCSSRHRQWVRSSNHTKATRDTWGFASGRLSGSLKTIAA